MSGVDAIPRKNQNPPDSGTRRDRPESLCHRPGLLPLLPVAALNRLFTHNNARKKMGQPTVGIPFIQLGFGTTDEGTRPCRHHRCLAQGNNKLFSSRVASSSRTGGARDANSLMAAPLARAPSKSSSNFLAARSFSSCCRLSCSAASAAAHFACSFFAFLTSPSHGARLFNTNPQGRRQALEDSFAISGLAAK
jgi:hypothetical protein